MSAPTVVVVEPKTPGNVGTIARAMKNFGMTDLKLVDPPEFDRDGDAYGFAGQAREDVLPNHDVVTFDEVVDQYHTVGLTATTNEDDSKHTRFPFKTPRELVQSLESVETETALVFGRERIGLTNEELARIDEICTIPASADYPVLNLGQAATILMYELRDVSVEETQVSNVERQRAPESEIERFYDRFEEFLEAADYPTEKRAKTGRMMRRLIGRAHPTGRETSTLLGLVRRATWHAERSTDE